MIQHPSADHSGSFGAILGFFLGCGAIYLGCRGFQARGMVLWHRSGSETRLTGWRGRVLGSLLVATGGWLIWGSLVMALQLR